jgi:hypothetical protein
MLTISRVTVTSTVDNMSGCGVGFMPGGFLLLVYVESSVFVFQYLNALPFATLVILVT